MKDYMINEDTLAILPCNDPKKSIVYEGDEVFIVNRRPNIIINTNCIRNGSTLDGRQKCSEKILGSSYKSPILLSEKDNIIFFPTSSPRLKSVAWVNSMRINDIFYNHAKKKTNIIFANGVMLEFGVSFNIINNQILRAARLEHCLRKK